MEAEFFDPSGDGAPVWLQHLYWLLGQPPFQIVWLIPPVVVIWLLWRAFQPSFVARLFLMDAVVSFIVSAMIGRGLALSAVDPLLHDTYYVVVQIHWLLSVVAACILFAFLYRYGPAIIGAPIRRWLGVSHWAAFTLGLALYIASFFGVSQAGLPRRYADYDARFDVWPLIFQLGAIVTVISFLIFAICLGETTYRRLKHGRSPTETDERAADHF